MLRKLLSFHSKIEKNDFHASAAGIVPDCQLRWELSLSVSDSLFATCFERRNREIITDLDLCHPSMNCIYLPLAVAQSLGVFVRLTTSRVVRQFMCVSINDTHGAAVLRLASGKRRNVIDRQSPMARRCSVRITWYVTQRTVPEYPIANIGRFRPKFSAPIFRWTMIMPVERILPCCNCLSMDNFFIHSRPAAGFPC